MMMHFDAIQTAAAAAAVYWCVCVCVLRACLSACHNACYIASQYTLWMLCSGIMQLPDCPPVLLHSKPKQRGKNPSKMVRASCINDV